MHRRTRRTIAVAALAGGLLALGACASSTTDDDSASPPSSTGASTDGTVAAPPGTAAARRTRSDGCDTTTASGPTATGVDEEVTLDIDGTARTYLRHVPPANDGATALPVVVDLHGYQEGAKIHTVMSAMGPYGDTQGFITITPQGEGEVPRWIAESGSDDVAFIGEVLDDVESTLCVDRDRIFVTGLSNGAFMTSTVACDLADRFAAAAPVAGIQDIEGCSPSRPVPVIAFHGTADTFVGYDGGLGASAMDLPAPDGSGRTLGDVIAEAEAAGPGGGTVPERGGPPVPTIAAAWAARNGCDASPTETPVTDDVTEISFACPAGADVQLYRITGGGHTWPGSAFSQSIADVVGPTTTSISANELMWAFFQAHPLPSS